MYAREIGAYFKMTVSTSRVSYVSRIFANRGENARTTTRSFTYHIKIVLSFFFKNTTNSRATDDRRSSLGTLSFEETLFLSLSLSFFFVFSIEVLRKRDKGLVISDFFVF